MAVGRRADRSNEWWVAFQYRRRRIRRRSPVQSKRGAEQYERRLREEFAIAETRGMLSFEKAPTLLEFSQRWTREYTAVRNRESVIRDKRIILQRHLLPALGHMRISEIATVDIDRLIATKARCGRKPKTINNILSVLHTALTSALDWGLIASVPRHHWLRVPEPRFRVLSETEQKALLCEVPDGFWRALIIFLLHTGARFSEAAAVQWDDLSFERQTPIVRVCRGGARGKPGETKTGSHRELPLTTDVIDELSRMPRRSHLIFPRPDGGMMNPSSKASYLYRFCRRSKVKPFGWHVFRHTYATSMAAAGTPIHILQRLLGHTTIKMTMRYVHVDQSTLADTVRTVQAALPISSRSNAPCATSHRDAAIAKMV